MKKKDLGIDIEHNFQPKYEISPDKKAIVKEFGEDTYHVLAKETWKLKKLKGFGEKTIEKIQIGAEKKLMEQDILSTIMRYIQGFGISPAYSKKIYNTYGLNSMQII